MSSTYISVDTAFSRQALHYDHNDIANPVLQQMRQQVYHHIEKFLHRESKILELNAGTGIDALHFAQQGHHVHAIDIAAGMIDQIKKKIEENSIQGSLTCQRLSFEDLDQIAENNADHIFSNFGGLNCCSDLSKVTKHFPRVLKPTGFATLVIMPPVCLWELISVFKGNFKHALRRFQPNGVMAHLEGEYFKTYYFSRASIEQALGEQFKLVACEGLAALGPQPHRGDFPSSHPFIYRSLMTADKAVRHYFPFNRWADHLILTFQYMPS